MLLNNVYHRLFFCFLYSVITIIDLEFIINKIMFSQLYINSTGCPWSSNSGFDFVIKAMLV